MRLSSVLSVFCLLALLSSCRPSPEKLLRSADKYHQNKKYKEASILYQKVIARDKTNAEAYYREGLNLIDQGNPVEASKFLRRAIDLRPQNSDAQAKLAEIYFTAYLTNRNRLKSLLPEVVELKNKLLQQDPNSFSGLRLEGLLALADKKTNEALTAFAKANAAKPYSRDLIPWYFGALNSAGQTDQAEALVRDTLQHDKTWGTGYDLLFAAYQKAKQLEKAEAMLRARVKNDPRSAAGVVNLANYLLTTNRYSEAEATMKNMLGDRTAFPNGRELMGDFYTRAQKFDAALSQYEAGTHEDSKNELRYQQRKVATYALMGRKADAIKLAKSLSERNSKDASTSELYASLLLQTSLQSDPTGTVDSLRKLVNSNPTDPVLHLELARAYLLTNNGPKALPESLEAISQESKKHAQRPSLIVPARILASRVYENAGQHAQALDQANQILQIQGGNPEARLLRGEALIGLHEADQAQPDLEQLVASLPRLNEARLALGGIYLEQKSYNKASDQFGAVWKSTPPDPRGFVALQRLAVAQGKTDQAVQAMADFVKQQGNPPALRYELAQFQILAGEQYAKTDPAKAKASFSEAESTYEQLTAAAGKSPDIWLRLGQVQQVLGKQEAALHSFEQASSAAPNNTEALLNRATILEQFGRKKEAGDLYNKILAIDPNNTPALNNVAFMNAENNTNLDQAMTFAERAKKQAPHSLDVSDTLGYVYLQKNLNAQALEIFRQDVQDRPQSPIFHLHLAMALLKQGDKDGARSEADKAMKSANPGLQDKIKSFVGQIG